MMQIYVERGAPLPAWLQRQVQQQQLLPPGFGPQAPAGRPSQPPPKYPSTRNQSWDQYVTVDFSTWAGGEGAAVRAQGAVGGTSAGGHGGPAAAASGDGHEGPVARPGAHGGALGVI